MNFVVTYDISNNKLRTRISRLLENNGERIQESVFEIAGIDKILWQRCYTSLKAFDLGETDSIRIYSICEKCRKSAEVFGEGIAFHEPEVYIF